MQLLQIAWTVITPIFLLIGLGFLLQRRIGFDIQSLVRLNFWIFVPALLFAQILDSHLSGADLLSIVVHFAILFALMFAITWYGAKLIGAGDRLQRAMTASVLFYNSGNYGLPVAKLAFSGDASVQAIIIMLQNVTNFTIGLALHAGGREGGNWRQTLRAVFRLPMVYTLIAAWLWRASHWPLPVPLDTALHELVQGLVPIALVTLGAQMATLKSHRFSREMALALSLRLGLGPLMGYLIVLALHNALHIHGLLAQELIVSTSFPTAVNSALLAMEYQNEPDYAAAIVFYSTLFSAVTVSVVIYLVRQVAL
ncbi:MAG: AEC family transporter [Abitibacteriaceae bacterium]|nr:AEC family transporter [Abditibacteriaceae bacterium]